MPVTPQETVLGRQNQPGRIPACPSHFFLQDIAFRIHRPHPEFSGFKRDLPYRHAVIPVIRGHFL